MSEDKTKLKERKTRNPDIIIFWIGLVISLIGIISTIVLSIALQLDTDDSRFRAVLSVFIFGVLILGFGLIVRRLRRKGIEDFVLGAITAFLGFILLYFPVLMFVMGIDDLFVKQYPYYLMMVGGVLVIIFGYFMEVYDLNIKFLQMMKRMKEVLKRMLARINWKLLRSPWNFFSLMGLTVIILTVIGILTSRYYHIAGAGLILFNFIFHFRKELAEIFKTIGRILETIAQAWWKVTKQIPRILKRFFQWIYNPERFKKIMRWIWKQIKVIGRSIKYIFVRNYLILFIFGVVLFFVLPKDVLNFEIRLAISSLVCLVAFVKPILDWREYFGEDVSSARTFLYKTSTKVTKRLKRRVIIRCPYCNYPNTSQRMDCWNCTKMLPRCKICNSFVEQGTEVAVCQHCDNIYHENHLRTWLRLNPKCPMCKEEIEKIETEELIIESDVQEPEGEEVP
ncbi:MAG: hypothetical protein H7641_12660 [Candidatus Heimdallarchaeota archaeon]|nr:hypothetical protein [Candidatus Heimdallarchaeota archaeon]MCK4878411.1 hypothetical protein [Candidatus Heimdallarchaeota archaeon]